MRPRSHLLLKVRSHRPDVAIVDIRMPPTYTDEGLAGAARIRVECLLDVAPENREEMQAELMATLVRLVGRR